MTVALRLRYRLTIASGRGATIFCIAAADEADAREKARRIASRLDTKNAKIFLTQGAAHIPLLPAGRLAHLIASVAAKPRPTA